MTDIDAMRHEPLTVGNFTAVYERGEGDNFHTSIYEGDYKGLLICRCNQNGRHFYQVPILLAGLDAKREAAALIASQARRIEELEDANNDALAAEAQLNLVRKRMEKLEAENKALKKVADFDYLETTVAENRLLRNLLKPFAEDADKWAETVPDDHRSLCTEPNSKTAHPGSETGFTVGDLRRAAAALKETMG